MSQSFNYTFEKMRDSNPTKPIDPASDKGVAEVKDADYPSGSNTRNVCFVWPEGKRIFLNYGYLISGEYHPQDNQIILSFTSHTLKLKGIRLEPLFYDLMGHVPKQILCKDARYNAVEENSCVNEITILSNER